jgi:uncharacterized low-complexity protein
MASKKTTLALALGSAFAVSLSTLPAAHASDTPFSMSALKSGYMLADADMGKDTKAGEGKCGGKAKEAMPAKAKDGKCGNAPANSKDSMKPTDKKMPEGKCGEGKCGAKKHAPADGK